MNFETSDEISTVIKHLAYKYKTTPEEIIRLAIALINVVDQESITGRKAAIVDDNDRAVVRLKVFEALLK